MVGPPSINQQIPFSWHVNAVLPQLLKRAGFNKLCHNSSQTKKSVWELKRHLIHVFLLPSVAAFLKRVGRCKWLLLEAGHGGRQAFHLFPVPFLSLCGNGQPATKEVEIGRFVEVLPLPRPSCTYIGHSEVSTWGLEIWPTRDRSSSGVAARARQDSTGHLT